MLNHAETLQVDFYRRRINLLSKVALTGILVCILGFGVDVIARIDLGIFILFALVISGISALFCAVCAFSIFVIKNRLGSDF